MSACHRCYEDREPIPERIDDSDWAEAFKYAAKPEAAIPGNSVPLGGFTREDVADIIAIIDGENDGL